MKVCSRCHEEKEFENFNKCSTSKDGYYAYCKPCNAARMKEYTAKNYAKVQEIHNRSGRKRYADPVKRARIRAQAKIYRSTPEGKAKRRLESYLYNLNNRPAKTAHTIAYRARKRAAAGTATVTQIMSRVAYYGFKCWICQAPYREIDHVKPLAKGGTNWPANLRPICRSCNAAKGDTWPLTNNFLSTLHTVAV